MARRYSIEGPDKFLYEFDGPENASQEQIMSYAKSLHDRRQESLQTAGVGEALKGGAKRMFGSLATAVTSPFGAEEAAKEGLARQEAITEKPGASLEKVKSVLGEKGYLAAAREAVSQVPTAIAEQFPNLAATIGSARLGAMAGSTFGPAGTVIGGIGGAFVPSLLQQTGSNLERQAQEGAPISGSGALAAAVPQAALDVFTDKLLFSRLMGIPAKTLGRADADAVVAKSIKRTLAEGTAKGVVAEVPTEVAQQMLERYQAGLSLTDEEARKEYADTAYQVALLGPLGAVGKLQDRGQARDVIAQDEAAQRAAAEQAQRQATGVMEQQPLFTPQEAPIQTPAAPEETPISTVVPEPTTTPPAFGFNEEGKFTNEPAPEVSPDQGALFTRKGAPSPAAKASVEAARLQGLPAQIDALIQTPEGRAQLAGDMKTYFPDLSVKERNALRPQIQAGTYGVEPVAPVAPVAPVEGTLTPDLLKTFGITPRSKQYKALVDANLADPTTYNLLTTAAATSTDFGVKANRILDAFPQYKPSEAAVTPTQPTPDEVANEPEAQAAEPVQPDLLGIPAVGATPIEPGAQQGMGQPVQQQGAAPAQAEEPVGGGVVVPSGAPVGNLGQPTASTNVQPSALAPVPPRVAKQAAAALKKEPITQAWGYMSDTPYAKLSKVAKDKVKDAHAQGYLTQELADEIDRIEAGNARAEAAAAAIKPETILEEAPAPAYKSKERTDHHARLLSRIKRAEDELETLNDPMPMEEAYAAVENAIAEFKRKAKVGMLGHYEEGEIEQTADAMRIDPLAYAFDGLSMSQRVINALSDPYRIEQKINNLTTEIEELNREIEQEEYKRYDLHRNEYNKVITRLIDEGSISSNDEDLYRHIADGNTSNALAWISKNTKRNKGTALVAKLLLDAGIYPRVQFERTSGDNALASYFAESDLVIMDPGYFLQDNISTPTMVNTFLHEVMHSATVNKLSLAFEMDRIQKTYAPKQLTDEEKKYFASAEYTTAKNIIEVFDWLRANHPKSFHPAMHYGATNPLEMMAEVFTNERFIVSLSDITLPAQLVSKQPINALTWFVRALKRLLGLEAAPDSAIVTIMKDTLALTSKRAFGARQEIATSGETAGRRLLYDKYRASGNVAPTGDINPAQIDPQAQAQAQQAIASMSGMYAQSNPQPVQTGAQVAANIGNLVRTNPSGAMEMMERKINAFRNKVVWRGATLADDIQRANDNAFRDAYGNVRADILMSQAENTQNITESVFTFGGIEITPDGTVRAKVADHSIDGVFGHAKTLADRIGADTARDLITKTFYAWRAQALLTLPRNEWPINWQQNPSLIPTQAQINAGMAAFNQFPELQAMKNEFVGAKNEAVKFLRQADFLTADKARAFLADDSYAPWFRLKEYDDTLPGLGNMGRMVDLKQMQALKGGSEEVNDMLENMAQVVSWFVRSGVSNHTANQALKTMEGMGTATPQRSRPTGTNPDNIVMTYVDGKRMFWTVSDPLQLQAFQSVKAINSPVIKAMSKGLGTLRAGIVLFPAFPLRQIVMDTYRAYAQSGVDHPSRLVGKVFKSFLSGEAYKAVSDDILEMKKYGVVGSADFNLSDSTRGRAEAYGLQGPEKGITATWLRSPVYKALHNFAYSADLAVRLGVYRQTMEETGDKELAIARAREIINFQKSGNSELMLTLKQLIPFMGAYLQGTDVNYRSMIGRGNSMKSRKAAAAAFWGNMATLAALTVAYTMAMSGEDEYEEQKGFITDRNFIIPGIGLLPVPPDIGFLSKVVPERITDYILQEGTDNPESVARLAQGIAGAAAAAYFPPAAVYGVTPAIELALNKSFFTDIPIVGQYMQGLEPFQQYTSNTSELAKVAGGIANMSPMKIDYLLKAIGGTAGGALLQMFDVVMSDNKIAREKNAILGTFQLKEVGGRYTEEFYETRALVDQSYQTIKALYESGNEEKLTEYASRPEVQRRMDIRSSIEQINTTLQEVRSARIAIENDPSLTPDEKRQQVNELQATVEQFLKEAGIRQLRSESE